MIDIIITVVLVIIAAYAGAWFALSGFDAKLTAWSRKVINKLRR